MQENWQGQKVVVVGAARQGLALARYLARKGAAVLLNDRRAESELQEERRALEDVESVRWLCGGHPLSALDGADLVCLSGGVSPGLPLAVEARKRGIPLSNDSQIFLEAAPCPVIGITGSAGKTTTTSLTGRILSEGIKLQPSLALGGRGAKVWVGGNIGTPLISMLDEMQPQDWAVMELSSFQLELMTRSPHVAVITNITPNHLDRHGTMEAYTRAKQRILDYQTERDAAILGRDDPGAWSLAGQVQGRLLSFGLGELPPEQAGMALSGDRLVLRTEPAGGGAGMEDVTVMAKELVELRGEHNLQNVLAACAAAAAAGFTPEAMRRGVAGFRGVPHRLEYIGKWGGAEWYNDSIATAPERAMAAIRSFDEPLVLLAGGRDKNLPWEDFARLVRQRVDHLVLFGEAAGLIQAAVTRAGQAGTGGPTITRCEGLREAVRAAAELVEPGDVVLLSPGGTSYDEFRDFEERGQCFARWVKELG